MLVPSSFAQVVAHYNYDAGNHVTQVTDPRGLLTTYSYDGLGQKWQETSPDTGTTSYGYDSYGRLAGMTRSDGGQTIYGYDGINRRTSETAGGLTHTIAYDNCANGVGRLCSLSDASTLTSYTYTPEGWITARGFTVNSVSYTVTYSYNAIGQATAIGYPGAIQALYTYTNGVVSAVQANIGGTLSNVATNIVYRPGDARMSQWTSSNGIVNSMAYDTDGRLASIQASAVQSLSLSYDAANRVNGITNGIDPAMTQSLGYDAMSHLTSVYSGSDNEVLQYDANGNRLSAVLNGASATVGVNASNNQVTSLSGATNMGYGYDARGNLTTVNGTTTFHYDPFNRMSSTGNATYYVNPEGQRVAKTVNGAINYFAPDESGSMLAEYQSTSGWIYYIWLNGRLIARINQGSLLAIHDDQVGRPEIMTDANKTVAWRARNFAFDRTVTLANAVPLNLGFPGQYYDSESGLWNNGFRDYSPSLGRYVESDPAGLAAGINTYAYVSSSPIQLFDAWGLTQSDINCMMALAKQQEADIKFPNTPPVVEDMPETTNSQGQTVITAGEYNHATGTMHLNSIYLGNLDLSMKVDLYDTIVHEGLHATRGFWSGFGKSHQRVFDDANARSKAQADNIGAGNLPCGCT